jgi:hypothetical protein
MLFDDRLLFLHTPKTGGMSITKFLIDNAPNRFTLSAPAHAKPVPGVTLIPGRRHERLHQAAERLAELGRGLKDFEAIMVVMRNPYETEVSHYHYERLGHPWDKGLAQDLAVAGDFRAFAREAPFYGRLPARIEDWYEIDGKAPANLRILRFENLKEELYGLVAKFYPISRELQTKNRTRHGSFRNYLDPESEQAIYRKFQWLFDRGFYNREESWL